MSSGKLIKLTSALLFSAINVDLPNMAMTNAGDESSFMSEIVLPSNVESGIDKGIIRIAQANPRINAVLNKIQIEVTTPPGDESICEYGPDRDENYFKFFKLTQPKILFKVRAGEVQHAHVEDAHCPVAVKEKFIRSRIKSRYNGQVCLEPIDMSFNLYDGNSERYNQVYLCNFANVSGIDFENIFITRILGSLRKSERDFSVVNLFGRIGPSGTVGHAAVMIVDHSNKINGTREDRIYLMDSDPGLFQNQGSLEANQDVFGENLARRIKCLNLSGQALQAGSTCTYFVASFTKLLAKKRSIREVIMFDERNNEPILDGVLVQEFWENIVGEYGPGFLNMDNWNLFMRRTVEALPFSTE